MLLWGWPCIPGGCHSTNVREAHDRSLGAAGEEFVVRFEVARLAHAGKEGLAGKVERVSETRGDGLGFDVLSFDESGRERLIEVKTTAFNFRKQPKLFCTQGPIDQAFGLEPSQFVARVT